MDSRQTGSAYGYFRIARDPDMIGAIYDKKPNCRAVKVIRWAGSALVRILSQDARGSVDYNSPFVEYGQKFSICHTFLVPLPSAMANDRPSGDGTAYRM